jgi:hypothetical protein
MHDDHAAVHGYKDYLTIAAQVRPLGRNLVADRHRRDDIEQTSNSNNLGSG